MPSLYPLRFRPLLRDYIWGGRRLETSLGKHLPPDGVWAESWEVVDHGPDQSVVEFGPLAGTTLGELVGGYGRELLGRHYPQPRFPLLVKYLDAAQTSSVQVHPDDARAARLDPPESGKTEAWVVIEAEPGSVIYAGLRAGVDRDRLAAAIRQGTCRDCLHVLHPTPGDCVFLPAGTVHALGGGLLVAEIQQSSDVTYRLFDWGRLGPEGRPRPLHVEQALEAIDFSRNKGTSLISGRPLQVAGIGTPPTSPISVMSPFSRLVECGKFVLDRWESDTALPAGGDGRCHIISVLRGGVQIEGDPAESPLPRGGTALLPAGPGMVRLTPQSGTVLLDAYLP